MGRFDALTQLDKKANKTPSFVEKPANPQSVLPDIPQGHLPANLQDGKPEKHICPKARKRVDSKLNDMLTMDEVIKRRHKKRTFGNVP